MFLGFSATLMLAQCLTEWYCTRKKACGLITQIMYMCCDGLNGCWLSRSGAAAQSKFSVSQNAVLVKELLHFQPGTPGASSQLMFDKKNLAASAWCVSYRAADDISCRVQQSSIFASGNSGPAGNIVAMKWLSLFAQPQPMHGLGPTAS